jgi:hypothetical protein
MADLDFFFDAVCPWAWITSRWVTEVQQQRSYDVAWRFISLKMINEELAADWYTPEYKASHFAGLYVHRVAHEVRVQHGNDAVGALYTATGIAFHNHQRRPEINADPVAFMAEMLGAAALPVALAEEALNDTHDAVVREETELAFSRTGRDVGTPIITFHPGEPTEGSFFGPVISTIPRGAEAERLWDAIEVIATTGVAELKRSIRARPEFD